jgi:hypothetical protein
MTTLPTLVTVSPEVLYQELDGEAILLNLQNEHYYSLKESGVRMWQLLAKHGDVATVTEQLLEEYDVDYATLNSDLAHLIAWLAERGLVKAEGG